MRADDILTLAAKDSARPVLLAGPTASGKSSLALRIAQDQGRAVVNADAIQVFENWRILTARPSVADEARGPHHLYGHVPGDAPYSVGTWLRDIAPLLDAIPAPIPAPAPAPTTAPVIVGGTGLYFTALTEGLADIPATPDATRRTALARLERGELSQMIAELDAPTRARIDTANPMRVQRAWEVLQTTGRGLANWQDSTDPPRLPLSQAIAIVIDAPKDWLTPRIEQRFDQMLAEGALEEARANLDTWDPSHPSSKAIGASELIDVVAGRMTKDDARDRATIATRQFAKRQRTWFRARMQGWTRIFAPDL
ncbi:MAG: tRNA (adenosine(37)-N6)-dimethylallyltransferase MiaA [Pseudomonadota bacterium]